MIIRKAYKFRLKTNQTKARKVAQFAGCSRLVWNKALAFQKERLNAKQSCLTYIGLTKKLTSWKKELDLFFLKQVHSQALQQSLKNLSQALKEAFDKTNPKQFPKFKKKGQRDSFRYISAENRKTQATFCCQQKDCSYTANADYVGSINIREAGLALLGLGGSLLEQPMKSQPADGV